MTDLHEVLGAHAFETLTRTGENMPNGEMASYALDQIELARAQLQVGESP
jgi:hypothetical protein